MSRNPAAPRPTDAELAILRVLWERGPSTVRQVHDVLVSRVGPTAYTTALKLMQIMSEKGVVRRVYLVITVFFKFLLIL
jgi:predicted transcriptional regulator